MSVKAYESRGVLRAIVYGAALRVARVQLPSTP
jgi:hypothetical protein